MNERIETTRNFSKTEADMALDTTTTPSTATLTEKDLWARFVASRIQTTYSTGPTVDSYCPDDLLLNPGMYETTGGFASAIADELAEADDPEETLECVIEDVAAYLEGLRTVRGAFASVKRSLMIHSDDETEESEVRYRAPFIQNGEAA